MIKMHVRAFKGVTGAGAVSVEVIQATESSQRKTVSQNSQEACSVYYETLAGFQLALGLPPPHTHPEDLQPV